MLLILLLDIVQHVFTSFPFVTSSLTAPITGGQMAEMASCSAVYLPYFSLFSKNKGMFWSFIYNTLYLYDKITM